MVSTHNRYKTDNFPVLRACVDRGERLYLVRLYEGRDGFLSPRSGFTRMRVILAFIESKTTVIDGVVKTGDGLDYLTVLCSSSAAPALFSTVINRAAPRAMIEEITEKRAESYLTRDASRDGTKPFIPFAGMVKTVNDSRRILLGLLLEYRALLAEYDHSINRAERVAPVPRGADFSIPFLFFELDGRICGVPSFQVMDLSRGGYDTTLITLKKNYGEGILTCSEVLCEKEINVPACEFLDRQRRGYYGVRVPVGEGVFSFTLIVPSLT